jgi:hypothetical protein
MKTNTLFFALGVILLSLFYSCKKDEPETPHIPHEEELITTLSYTLVAVDSGDTIQFTFKDIDGDGGMEPEISEGTLKANTTYNGSMLLLNEAETPVHDVTHEIEHEAEEHQFFFTSTISDVDIAYLDSDANKKPIGLKTTFKTGTPNSGTLTVVLKHEPDKDAEGVANGNVKNAGGETDIEVTFKIKVE